MTTDADSTDDVFWPLSSSFCAGSKSFRSSGLGRASDGLGSGSISLYHQDRTTKPPESETRRITFLPGIPRGMRTSNVTQCSNWWQYRRWESILKKIGALHFYLDAGGGVHHVTTVRLTPWDTQGCGSSLSLLKWMEYVEESNCCNVLSLQCLPASGHLPKSITSQMVLQRKRPCTWCACSFWPYCVLLQIYVVCCLLQQPCVLHLLGSPVQLLELPMWLFGLVALICDMRPDPTGVYSLAQCSIEAVQRRDGTFRLQ